jgi:hypothetical protein
MHKLWREAWYHYHQVPRFFEKVPDKGLKRKLNSKKLFIFICLVTYEKSQKYKPKTAEQNALKSN